MAEQTPQPAQQRGTYNHIRCGVCGHPYVSHPEECARHKFLPTWAPWLRDNPDPRDYDQSVIVGIAADPETVFHRAAIASVTHWIGRAQAAGVPEELIKPLPKPRTIVNGTAH